VQYVGVTKKRYSETNLCHVVLKIWQPQALEMQIAQVKLSLGLIKHHSMKMYGRLEVVDGGE
jgi:hypothetical protein